MIDRVVCIRNDLNSGADLEGNDIDINRILSFNKLSTISTLWNRLTLSQNTYRFVVKPLRLVILLLKY